MSNVFVIGIFVTFLFILGFGITIYEFRNLNEKFFHFLLTDKFLVYLFLVRKKKVIKKIPNTIPI